MLGEHLDAASAGYRVGFSDADTCNTAPLQTFTLQGTASALPLITLTGVNSTSTWLIPREITNHATSTSLYLRGTLLVANGQ
jgi:hypothetical protein